MSKGLVARIAGVVFSPRATYGGVAVRPRWFGVLAFVVALGSAGVYAFLSTTVGQNAMVDQQVRQSESLGRPLTDAQYERLEQLAPYGKYFGVGYQVIVMPLAGVIIAGLAFAVFNAVMGGDASFKQVFAVVAHSGVILALLQMFFLPVAFARESLSSTTSLAIFAPFLDENSFAGRLLGAVDLVFIWWIVSLAIGLGVLYRKRTGPIAWTMLAIYLAIGVVIAAVKSAVS